MSDNNVMADETRTTLLTSRWGNNTGLKYKAEGKEFWYQLCVLYEANRETKYGDRMSTFLDHEDSGPQVKNENKYRMKMSRSYKQYKAGTLTSGMGQKKRSCNRKHVDIEEALSRELDVHRMFEGGAIPTRASVRKMALRIAKQLGKEESFKASPAWLDSVLERKISQSSSLFPSEMDAGYGDLGGYHEDIESGSIPYVASPNNPHDLESGVMESEGMSPVAQEAIERRKGRFAYKSPSDGFDDKREGVDRSCQDDETSIEHEALHGAWFKPEETLLREETVTDMRHPDAFIDLPSSNSDTGIFAVMTPDAPPLPQPAEKLDDEKNTFKRQYPSILKTLIAGIVHLRLAVSEKMHPQLSPSSEATENESDEPRQRQEVSRRQLPRWFLPGFWRFDARETSEHLAPHPRLGYMLGSSFELQSLSSQYERQHQESGGFIDEEPDTASFDVSVKVSKKWQPPRWFLALLWALVLVAMAGFVVTLVVSHGIGAQLEGNYTIESAPSSSPSAPSSSPSQDAPEWEQLGQVLRGAERLVQWGRTMAISSGGFIVAASTRVLSPSNDAAPKDYVRVHQLNSNSQWVQLGDDIETTDQTFVDLAKNGTVLLIVAVGRRDGSTGGSVKLFEWSATDGWNQLGDTIVADASEDWPSRYFGYESKISEDGSVVAVRDPGAGVVKAYSMVAGSWTQVGQTLVAGKTTSINGIGTVMAIGDYNNGREEPVVRVYTYQQGTRKWEQRGNVIERAMIDSTSDWKNHRLSVSLSLDGNSVAVGNRDSYNSKGMVQVLRYVEGNWVRWGAMVIGNFSYNGFGSSVSLSADGSMFAAGSSSRGEESTVYYYLKESKRWEMIGGAIDSLLGFTEASYVALASDGMTVAVAGTWEETVAIFHLV